jgi:hypothetical protein
MRRALGFLVPELVRTGVASRSHARGRLRRGPSGAAARVVARAAELAGIAVAGALLPLWPLGATLVARDASYIKRYPASMVGAARHLRGVMRGRSVSRFVLRKLDGGIPPGEHIAGACSHCGNCCLHRSCMFLAYDRQGRSNCRIYGGRLWSLLACGEYPLHGRDIALYDCPSFSAVPARPVAGRVIPIMPLASPRFDPGGPAHARACDRSQ